MEPMRLYEATFVRVGNPIQISSSFILLAEIVNKSTGEIFRDHTWVRNSKRISKLDLKSGEKIIFMAREEEYVSISSNKMGLRHLRNIIKKGKENA